MTVEIHFLQTYRSELILLDPKDHFIECDFHHCLLVAPPVGEVLIEDSVLYDCTWVSYEEYISKTSIGRGDWYGLGHSFQ